MTDKMFRFLMTGVCVLVVVAFTLPADAGMKRMVKRGHMAKVMTRNLYVGADLFTLLSGDLTNPMTIPTNVAALINRVHQTDFPERAMALADEIATLKPDLIGLQEVSLIRVQSPGDYLIGNPDAAEEVLYDYLEILLNELALRGLKYEVAGIVQNADVELPMLAGFDETGPLFDDARLTDRDVVLKRSNVKTSNVDTRNYAVNFEVPVGSATVVFTRGFVAMDAKIRGVTYRFVNTHLEVEGKDYEFIQTLQAGELMAALEGETLPIILVGDFNSSPESADTQPYSLIEQAGFDDVWTHSFWQFEDGFTCCQEADLFNEASLLDERIDLVFVRNNRGFLPFSITGPAFSIVIGDEQRDKTPSGLWPSDHAGVHAWLWIPRLRFSAR